MFKGILPSLQAANPPETHRIPSNEFGFGWAQTVVVFPRLSDISRSTKDEMDIKYLTRWWFQILFYSPLFGEDFQFGYVIFFRWVETTNQNII